MSTEDRWVIGFEGFYYVSKQGRIFSTYSKKYLKPRRAGYNYWSVCLRKNNKSYYKYIHQVVIEAFVGPCPNGQECMHGDNNTSNNNLYNLSYGTRKKNMENRISTGSQKGSNNGYSKLTEEKVNVIKSMFITHTDTEICKIFNVCRETIGYIRRGKTWKHL